MKLWSSDGDRDGGDRPDSSSRFPADDDAPNEHTRLLPNPVASPNRGDSTTYLSPDDPAVSPYNLWSVRIVRYATIVFALLAFFWWTILLVSAFVTPPGFSTRGSGFFPFSYASLALADLAFTLVFFAAPSRAVRVLSTVMGILLLADTVLLLAVARTRHEEGWVGMVGVLWAFLMSVWTLLTDRLVQWGKSEEEERLTGRAETRRTLGEWTAVLLSVIIMSVLTIVVFFLTCNLVLRSLDAGLAPPGELYWVDGGKYQVHVFCYGNDTTADDDSTLPTVLIEGGEDTVEHSLWHFADEAVNNGSISRYCFVDRPGMAWSDAAPSPLSAGMAVEATSEALAKAGEDGPWVLVSAGIGSIYSRIFSARHGSEVKGLLLIDPLHEDLLEDVGAPGRGFRLWIRGVLSPLGLDRIWGALFRGRTREDRVWGRSVGQGGKYIFAKLQENLVAATLSRREADSSRAIQRPDAPLTLVSSGDRVRADPGWADRQRDLSHLTRDLRHWDIVDGAPHSVWENPDGRQTIEKRLRELVRI